MKLHLLTVLIFCTSLCLAQKSRRIKVESLSKPNALLQEISYDDALKMMVREYIGTANLPLNIIARSEMTDSLVKLSFKYPSNNFISGLQEAYAKHRPFTLSPDMIWLLISQGFAHHVNANAEQLRSRFVNFTGKTSLIVKDNRISLKNPKAPWQEVFPQFTKKIAASTGKELIDVLSCNFSTSTAVTRVASEITIMEAMKPYFEYIVLLIGCGVPEITLEGTPKDWQKVYDKAQALKKYDCDWWLNELDPVLKNFIAAANGKNDKGFWRDMFIQECDKKKMCGAPDFVINGWIAKFYPYSKEGHRNNLNEIKKIKDLPDEMVKTELKHIELSSDGSQMIETPLELWAGFTGLSQDKKTFRLRPEIGWMIRKADSNLVAKQLKPDAFGTLSIRVKEVPKEIIQLDAIKSLTIYFTDEIHIPEEMKSVKIEHLRLHGKISPQEGERIKKLFPHTDLMFNHF